ncbi:MAG: RsmB/NOP family class I SAM-dependent RNA methyltransferase [bacterium]
MTPAARLSAAIEVLDRVLAGGPVEQTLTNWGRANRYAGSGDRHALRDLVFDALRCRRSFAALGGSETGRGLVLGGVRAAGHDPADLFTGAGHAPAVVRGDEAGSVPEGAVALDVPDWLVERLQNSLRADYVAVMQAMQHRAPVFLRVNLARGTVAAAVAALAEEAIVVRRVEWMNTALQVIDNERRVQRSQAYLTGLVELQDASSQAVVATLDIAAGMRVLDYCAGGGGKTLALAARGVAVDAHDLNPHRMKDLPERAARAGARVRIVENPAKTAPYDLILMDVPCSGSGSWRRDPQGKWALTEARLAEVLQAQSDILQTCSRLVRQGGQLAYVTCSLLAEENEGQVAGFAARNPDWHVARQQRFSPLQGGSSVGGDGFFAATLTRV